MAATPKVRPRGTSPWTPGTRSNGGQKPRRAQPPLGAFPLVRSAGKNTRNKTNSPPFSVRKRSSNPKRERVKLMWREAVAKVAAAKETTKRMGTAPRSGVTNRHWRCIHWRRFWIPRARSGLTTTTRIRTTAICKCTACALLSTRSNWWLPPRKNLRCGYTAGLVSVYPTYLTSTSLNQRLKPLYRNQLTSVLLSVPKLIMRPGTTDHLRSVRSEQPTVSDRNFSRPSLPAPQKQVDTIIDCFVAERHTPAVNVTQGLRGCPARVSSLEQVYRKLIVRFEKPITFAPRRTTPLANADIAF